MRYLLPYAFILAAGLMWVARALQPASFSEQMVVLVLAGAVIFKAVNLYKDE